MTSLDKLLYDASQGIFSEIEGGIDIDTLRLTDKQIDGVTIVTDADGKIKVADDFVISDIEISDVVDLQEKLDDIQTVLDNKTELPISADDVNESSSKQFIDGALKAQITANTSDISGFGQRISELETEVDGMVTTDEMVKLDANDTAGYLGDKVDNVTLEVSNGKIVAKTLDGLTTALEQLNYLNTLTGNVQSQIDNLNSITTFSEIVPTENDLPTIVGSAGTTVLVREDSTQDGSSTFYTSDGNAWVYISKISSNATRDFTLNPIKLTTETDEILPKTRYEKQNASETPFTDSSGNIQASNTEEAIKEVFQYSDSIRKQWSNAIGSPLTQTDKLQDQLIKYNSLIENITNAITSKGVAAYPYNKLNELPNKIIAIPNVSVATGTKKVILEDVIAPHTESIILTEQLQLADVNTTLIEIVGGQDDVTHYDVKFEESDKNKFVENTFIEFNSGMRLKVGVDINMTNTSSQVDGYSKHVLALNENDFETYNGFKVV